MDYSRYDDPRTGDNGLLEVAQCPNTAAALTNCAYLAPGVIDPQIHYIMVDRQFVFTVRYLQRKKKKGGGRETFRC